MWYWSITYIPVHRQQIIVGANVGQDLGKRPKLWSQLLAISSEFFAWHWSGYCITVFCTTWLWAFRSVLFSLGSKTMTPALPPTLSPFFLRYTKVPIPRYLELPRLCHFMIYCTPRTKSWLLYLLSLIYCNQRQPPWNNKFLISSHFSRFFTLPSTLPKTNNSTSQHTC